MCDNISRGVSCLSPWMGSIIPCTWSKICDSHGCTVEICLSDSLMTISLSAWRTTFLKDPSSDDLRILQRFSSVLVRQVSVLDLVHTFLRWGQVVHRLVIMGLGRRQLRMCLIRCKKIVVWLRKLVSTRRPGIFVDHFDFCLVVTLGRRLYS